MYVRNLVDEIPDHVTYAHHRRYLRTTRIIADLAAGYEPPYVPHLLIEPQLRLPVKDNRFIYVAPDFAVFDPQTKCYVVGEEKSMIVRSESPDQVDLERARRQAGAEVLALQFLVEQFELVDRLRSRSIFIFASPFGVKPHTPVEELLHAEVSEIPRALENYRRISAELSLPAGKDTIKVLNTRAPNLRFNFQDTCMSSCALFSYCKARANFTARVLGDEVADAFGADTQLEPLMALMSDPGSARSAKEVILAARLREALVVLGIDVNNAVGKMGIS